MIKFIFYIIHNNSLPYYKKYLFIFQMIISKHNLFLFNYNIYLLGFIKNIMGSLMNMIRIVHSV